MAEQNQHVGRFIGFDPNTTQEAGRGIEFHARYFEPETDVPTIEPDVIVMRHVLEHLTDSAVFVDQLAWSIAGLGKPVLFFAEMPCVDRAQKSNRLVDFYFEHPSQFTTQSFRTLMQRAGEIVELAHGYDGEVVYSLVRLAVTEAQKRTAASALTFSQQATRTRVTIRRQLADLASQGKRIAIWGGTGKAAAFIHQFTVDAERFPLVVDSDAGKVGTFVPGAGQEIVSKDVLKRAPADIVIIPTQWRVKDIVAEMQREGILARQILIEHDGRLVDFAVDDHPYR